MTAPDRLSKLRHSWYARAMQRFMTFATVATLSIGSLPAVSGAWLVTQQTLQGNVITAATLGPVTNFNYTNTNNAVNFSWDSAYGQNWAQSNHVTTGATYTINQTFPDGTSNTVYSGSAPNASVSQKVSFKQLAASQTSIIGLASDGHVYQWGSWPAGYTGGISKSNIPQLVPGLRNITYVAATYYSLFARDSAGNIYAWGGNDYGQLGSGDNSVPNGPTLTETWPKNVVQIAGGQLATYMLTSDGNVWVAGGNTPALGNGTQYSSVRTFQTPQRNGSLSNVTQIGGGYQNGYALVANRVLAWGVGNAGSIGNGSNQDQPYPQYVLNQSGNAYFGNIVSIGAGTYNAYLTTSGGYSYGWGYNQTQSIGNGSTGQQNTAQYIDNSNQDRFSLVLGNDDAGYALDGNGYVYSWGDNAYGEGGLGYSSNTPTSLATKTDLGPVSSLVASGNFACALQSGQAMCWGRNDQGQLGIGAVGGSYNAASPTVQSLLPTPGSKFSISYTYYGWVAPPVALTR